MKNTQVAVVMGSDSDLPVMEDTLSVLRKFSVAFETRILSAHRTPDQVKNYVADAGKRGIQVFIAGAGGAAHLAGVIASHTTCPVIGVPLSATPLNGLDALLATVQMPAGVPVATVAVGKPGAYNAGLLAVQCLALSDRSLGDQLAAFKKELEAKVDEKNKKVQEKLQK